MGVPYVVLPDLCEDGAAGLVADELRRRDVTDVVCALGFAPTFVPQECDIEYQV